MMTDNPFIFYMSLPVGQQLWLLLPLTAIILVSGLVAQSVIRVLIQGAGSTIVGICITLAKRGFIPWYDGPYEWDEELPDGRRLTSVIRGLGGHTNSSQKQTDDESTRHNR